MASLHLLKGPGAREPAPLTKAVTILGREAKDCDIVIPNQAVSRVHAQITDVNGQFFIEDLKSRNHTYLNNQQVEGKQLLRDNDRIKICDAMYTFRTGVEGLAPLPDDMRPQKQGDGDVDLPSTVQATLSRLPQHQLLETQPVERLRALLEISATLNSAITQEELLEKILDVLFQVFRQSDRAIIVLVDEATGNPIARNYRSRRENDELPRFSRTIVRKCLDKMEAFLVEDAATDSSFNMAQSIADFRIRSVMIAPMGPPDGPAFGVIQLDTLDRSKRFTQDDLKLLISVANQASVAMENARLLAEQVRRERVMRDLQIAKQVQHSFLPQQLPAVPGYEFFAHYNSAMTIGGDYYDFVELQDGRLAILLGDVAGKGVPAALLMAKLSAEARFHVQMQASAADAFAKINEFLWRAGLSDRFVTMAGAILDPKGHNVQLINAGHVPPMIYRAGTEDLFEAVDAERSGFPLGVMPESQYTIVDVRLGPGETLLVFTDGVTDALNPANKQFRIEGVKKAVCQESVVDSTMHSPARVGKRLIEAVKNHISDRDQYDDIALVSFGRYDCPPASGTSISKLNTSTFDESPLK